MAYMTCEKIKETKYRLTETKIEEKTIYGIEISQELCGKIFKKTAPYISLSRNDAQQFLNRIEAAGVGAIHFQEIIEDYLWDGMKNSFKSVVI